VVRVPIPRGLDANELLTAGQPLVQFLKSTVQKETDMTPIVVDKEPPQSPSAVTEGLVNADDDVAVFRWGDRSYRVKGLLKIMQTDPLKVQLIASRKDLIHPDTLDLYQANARKSFALGASGDLGVDFNVIKQDLSRLFSAVEQLRTERRQALLKPKVVLTEQQRADALALLRDPNLLTRIVDDFAAGGVVGEETNKLVAYLGATSRKLQKPLAVLVRSSSSAGKSSLMDAVLAFIPDEEKLVFSAMTGQALYYLEGDMKHKVLAIAEDEGSESAAQPLKLLQSDGKLKRLAPGKDPTGARIVTQTYEVEGPVALLSTTTAIEVDDELLNRCIELTVDESREQTRRIHEAQRNLETLEGKQRFHHQRAVVVELHQNAQRLLACVDVINPFAKELTFTDQKIRSRRDHAKLLALIRVIALLHQHQRVTKFYDDGKPYIEATRDDVAVAQRLADEVLSSLDELPPKTRELFVKIEAMAAAKQKERGNDDDVRFTMKDVCESLQLTDTAARRHLDRLARAELIETTQRTGHTQRAWYRVVTAPNAFALKQTSHTSNPIPTALTQGGVGGFSVPNVSKDHEKVKTSHSKPARAVPGKKPAAAVPAPFALVKPPATASPAPALPINVAGGLSVPEDAKDRELPTTSSAQAKSAEPASTKGRERPAVIARRRK